MHDERLSRTTNVASVFPERISAHSSDFSWAELQKLNAGTWFLEVRTPAKMRPPLSGTQGRVHSSNTYLLHPVLVS